MWAFLKRQKRHFYRNQISRPWVRVVLLWLAVALVNLGGALFLHWTQSQISSTSSAYRISIELFLAACLITLLSTFLVTAPYVHFLSHGWYSRYYEFRNALEGDALLDYLKRFWFQRYDEIRKSSSTPNPQPIANIHAMAGDVFEKIYLDQYSSLTFGIPFTFILIVTYLNSLALVILNKCEVQSGACQINMLGAAPQVAIAAMAGAYMFSVADSVMSIRRRTLNVSDMYWYGLRQFLAIPIALCFSIPAGQGSSTDVKLSIAAALSFTVALLPIDALLKALRRYAYTALSINPDDEQSDQLLQLSGMTSAHVVMFLSEGIYSIEQVACMDPVLIAIRTGLPFRLITGFGGQAIVRRHFSGDCLKALISMGFGDAASILDLMSRPATCDCYTKICKAIADRLSSDAGKVEQAALEMKFRQIASEDYTQMLGKLRNGDNDLQPRVCSLRKNSDNATDRPPEGQEAAG
jgi:hypothetical protein